MIATPVMFSLVAYNGSKTIVKPNAPYKTFRFLLLIFSALFIGQSHIYLASTTSATRSFINLFLLKSVFPLAVLDAFNLNLIPF